MRGKSVKMMKSFKKEEEQSNTEIYLYLQPTKKKQEAEQNKQNSKKT
jgi:hypothetical protein